MEETEEDREMKEYEESMLADLEAQEANVAF